MRLPRRRGRSPHFLSSAVMRDNKFTYTIANLTVQSLDSGMNKLFVQWRFVACRLFGACAKSNLRPTYVGGCNISGWRDSSTALFPRPWKPPLQTIRQFSPAAYGKIGWTTIEMRCGGPLLSTPPLAVPPLSFKVMKRFAIP